MLGEIVSEVLLQTFYLTLVFICEPSELFAIFPDSITYIQIIFVEGPQSVAFALRPETLVELTVCVSVEAVAVLLAGPEFAHVDPAIRPQVQADSMHAVVLPFAVVLAAIGPATLPQAVYIVILEVANVASVILPVVLSSTMPYSGVLPLIVSVAKSQLTEASRLKFDKFALIELPHTTQLLELVLALIKFHHVL